MVACICGFRAGQRVKMKSAIVNLKGESVGIVHGVVESWQAGCGHIVTWDEFPTATGLPNPNVEADAKEGDDHGIRHQESACKPPTVTHEASGEGPAASTNHAQSQAR